MYPQVRIPAAIVRIVKEIARKGEPLQTYRCWAWGSSYYLPAVLTGPIAADTGWPFASRGPAKGLPVGCYSLLQAATGCYGSRA